MIPISKYNTFCVRAITLCIHVKKLFHFGLNTSLHFEAVVITFCGVTGFRLSSLNYQVFFFPSGIF